MQMSMTPSQVRRTKDVMKFGVALMLTVAASNALAGTGGERTDVALD